VTRTGGRNASAGSDRSVAEALDGSGDGIDAGTGARVRAPHVLMRLALRAAVLVLATGCAGDDEPLTPPPPPSSPPFAGTIFIDPDIITPADPTTFENVSPAGQGMRTMFDRRVNAFISLNAFLFQATYEDGLTVEVQVNPEFGTADAAGVQATKYARVIGYLPTALRRDVETVWIHMGTEPFGGGNRNLLIHVGQADAYVADGILEETLVHEAAHTSLDAMHAASSGWLAAQQADPTFISTYARDNPAREDIAESFLPWLAVRHRSSRISQALAETITRTIPNRLTYFDQQNFDLFPMLPSGR